MCYTLRCVRDVLRVYGRCVGECVKVGAYQGGVQVA